MFFGSRVLCQIGMKKKKEEKYEEVLEAYISQTTKVNFLIFGMYMEGITYVNLIEISPVVIEI